jgi:hypothetical protein
MKNKNEQENCISCKEIEKAIEELQNIVRKKVDEIDAKINSEKHSASEYYLSDMKGFSRGMSIMGNHALSFLRKRLLENT